MKPKHLPIVALLCCTGIAQAQTPAPDMETAKAAVQEIKLKDFRPESIFRIPVTQVEKARFAAIDIHSHDYARTDEEIRDWVEAQKACGIERTHILHCNWIGEPFETFVEKYAPYADQFAFWCCFDYTGYDEPDWAERAVAQLEKCRRMGAVGVGELVDKGTGDLYANPVPGEGIHMDDPKMRPLLERCGQLGMPVSIHIAEPIWMYLPLDERNDGLMNGANWAVDTTVEGCRDYEELMATFERTVAAYPGTTFIACHYLNMNQDLERLGALLDKYPNLYVDLSGRMGEAAVTPRATRRFLLKYADRVLYGTDNGMSPSMYRLTFRLLETEDEHIYNPDFGYHWAYGGFHLPDKVLRKIYRDNALRILKK
ncbi:MAG: amidohydrolase [Alistipes sp.]|nr:amidohydrolase [Alistipes senegalensis]MCM1249624.1 amidohydrolase [Alistipes sp.]